MGVAIRAAAALLLFLAAGAGCGESGVVSQPAETTSTTEHVPIEASLEGFMDAQAIELRSRWAGWRYDGDGTATVWLTEGPVPEVLAGDPRVDVLPARFTFDHLSAVHQVVADRLNALLAPGIPPGTQLDEGWPYHSRVDMADNVVDVTVESEHEDRRREIEEALADELARGTVRVRYGEVLAARRAP